MTVKYLSASGTKTDTPCRVWHGLRNDKGYGLRLYPPTGKLERTHRIAYIEAHGLKMADIADVLIRHTCDNPPCRNPEHLIAGTHDDNMRDKVERNRQPKGEAHWQAALTEEQVREIKKRLAYGQKHRIIASEFKVTRETITAIRSGRSWAHVT